MFRDRIDAGRQLAERLKPLALKDPVVLGIPRGGVVTAAAIADGLGAEMDVVLAHKLRCPYQPELAFGAIGEEGEVYVNQEVVRRVHLTSRDFDREQAIQIENLRQRSEQIRAIRPAAEIQGRSVILTDDGVATGSTMLAAIEVIRRRHPQEIIVAMPVAPADRVGQFRAHCDRWICLNSAEDFWSVGAFYQTFEPVTDEEVSQLLKKHRHHAETAE